MHYNTADEVDRLLEVMEQHLAVARPRPAAQPA
jgi:hypothetical protein